MSGVVEQGPVLAMRDTFDRLCRHLGAARDPGLSGKLREVAVP
ncbi:MAG TPA: hypothetical protein VMH26_18770 [Burkholderiales bacterium]|nr:hypothetical protein [Burkholderiales bacterium]